jgi:hypothetical protein
MGSVANVSQQLHRAKCRGQRSPPELESLIGRRSEFELIASSPDFPRHATLRGAIPLLKNILLTPEHG